MNEDDLVLLGVEFERELRLEYHELSVKKTLLEEARRECEVAQLELEDVKSRLEKANKEIEELKIQLNMRMNAAQQMELENSTLRENFAKLKIQSESYNLERTKLLNRCQTAEAELVVLRQEKIDLKGKLECNDAFKMNCLSLQSRTRQLVDQITSKQSEVEKEHAKLQQSFLECQRFGDEVKKYADLQSELLLKSKETQKATEHKMAVLAALLEQTVEEKQKLETPNTDQLVHEPTPSSAIDWTVYKSTIQDRLDGYAKEIELLKKEVELLRGSKEGKNGGFCEKNKAELIEQT